MPSPLSSPSEALRTTGFTITVREVVTQLLVCCSSAFQALLELNLSLVFANGGPADEDEVAAMKAADESEAKRRAEREAKLKAFAEKELKEAAESKAEQDG